MIRAGRFVAKTGCYVLLLSAWLAGAAPKSGGNFAIWPAQIRKALYVPDKLPPLEAKIWSSFSPTPGVIADCVTYRTADGMLVPAIVYRPEKYKGKLPGIVVVNGHGGDKYSWYAFYSGMMFAKAGAEVVTYDPIGEGERNIEKKSRAGSHDKIQPAPAGRNADVFHQEWGQRLAGLMQVDLMQGVSYLAQRPEVDPKRIAVVGYSMGAFVAGIAGAIDTRIHAVLLSGGGTFDDQADGGKSFDVGTLPCQAPPWLSLKVLGSGFHQRGAILYALNAERGPMLVENGSADTVMDIPHRTPEWFAAMRTQAVALDQANGGTAANMFTTHVDADKSHRTAWVERYGVAWLNEQIHFANWSAEDIAKMPTTHVSDWIKANKVDISNGYLSEDREGGLDALGTGLPGIPRDQLTALPDSDWEKLKLELIYEGWAQTANAAATVKARTPGSR